METTVKEILVKYPLLDDNDKLIFDSSDLSNEGQSLQYSTVNYKDKITLTNKEETQVKYVPSIIDDRDIRYIGGKKKNTIDIGKNLSLPISKVISDYGYSEGTSLTKIIDAIREGRVINPTSKFDFITKPKKEDLPLIESGEVSYIKYDFLVTKQLVDYRKYQQKQLKSALSEYLVVKE